MVRWVELARWRILRRMSQASLAEKSGLTQAGISQIERGLRSPTTGTLLRLSQALGVSPERLWELARRPSLGREQTDRLARAIVEGKSSFLSDREREFAHAAGALVIQKLRAHRAEGRIRYARSRWEAAGRPIRVKQLYGKGPVQQVLHRVDLLLAMRSDTP